MAASGLFARETPRDAPGRVLELAGGPVHVVVDGALSDPVCAFVHGIPGSARDARYLGPALARRGLCCVRIDMPGFAGTPRATMPATTATARARFVCAVMDALAVERFCVIGHSIGGATALACAAQDRERVCALVLINSVGVRRHRGLVVPASVLTATATFLAGRSRAGASAALAVWVRRAWAARIGADARVNSNDDDDRHTLAHHLGIVGDLDFVTQRKRARAVLCPTLVVGMDDDALVQPAVTTTLARALTAAVLVTQLRAKTGGHHGQKIAAGPIAAWCANLLKPAH